MNPILSAKNSHQVFFLILTVILILNFSHASYCQTWTQQSKGMNGSYVISFGAKDNFIFAGTMFAGIFRSSDNGITWSAANNGVIDKWITSFAVKGDSLFAGCFNSGILVSIDNGNSWQQLSKTGMSSTQINSLYVFNKKLFAGTPYGMFSTSNFSSWNSASNGLPVSSGSISWINNISAFGSTLVAGMNATGAFLSNDNGANWIAISAIPSNAIVTSILYANSIVYIGTNVGLYSSTNAGSTWTLDGNLPSSIVSIGSTALKLFVLSNSGLYESDNNGASWNYQSIPRVNGDDWPNMLFANGTDVYVATGGSGVVHSSDGADWNVRNVGMTGLTARTILTHKDYVFTSTPNGLFRSAVKSNTWANVSPSVTPVVVKGDSLVTFISSQPYFSIDNGTSWMSFPSNGISVGQQPQALYVYRGNIYANMPDGGLTRFPRNGNSWEPVIYPTEYFNSNTMTSVNDTLFVGSLNGNFYVSTNEGVSWTKNNNGLPNNSGFNSLVAAGNKIVGVFFNGIFSTSAGQIYWRKTDVAATSTFQCLYNSSKNIFTGNFSGAYFSPDNGVTWSTANPSGKPTNVQFFSFTSTDSLIYAGTSEGVWTASISDFSPSISSFSPTSGVAGTSVTITGKNFSADRKSNAVLINGKPADVLGADFNTVIISVPPGTTTGLINITVNGKKVTTAKQFCVATSMPSVSLSISSTNVPTLTSDNTTGNQWLLNGTPISGATSQTYNPTVSGNYSILVSLGDCQFQSPDYNFVVTGLEQSNSSGPQAYPIPFRHELYVSLTNFDPGSSVHIRLLNIFGVEIGEWSEFGGGVLTIPTPQIASGLYILTTTQGSRNYSLRVVKY